MSLPVRVLVTALLAQTILAQTASAPQEDYSGTYSFLKEGEFIQITVEDKGNVSGFISRFGDSENDKGSFLDQFFKSGKLEGNQLTFETDALHGVSFAFKGTLDRGEGKKPEEEGYYVVRGTLTRFMTGPDKQTSSQERQVEFKSFPRDTSPPQ